MEKNRTPHQQRIIRNYYEHHDAIMVQRLSELVGDLYLAEGKARAKLWQRAVAAMKKLKIPKAQVQQLVQSDNPSLLASLVEELLKK